MGKVPRNTIGYLKWCLKTNLFKLEKPQISWNLLIDLPSFLPSSHLMGIWYKVYLPYSDTCPPCLRWSVLPGLDVIGDRMVHLEKTIGPGPTWYPGGFKHGDWWFHWIGLRENLQETMVFTIKYRAFLSCRATPCFFLWAIKCLWSKQG